MERIQAAQMELLRSVKGITIMDKIRNEEIRKEHELFSMDEKGKEYKIRWLEYLQRMSC
jgi:hypothetical protein